MRSRQYKPRLASATLHAQRVTRPQAWAFSMPLHPCWKAQTAADVAQHWCAKMLLKHQNLRNHGRESMPLPPAPRAAQGCAGRGEAAAAALNAIAGPARPHST